MLLGDADVEDPVREVLGEPAQADRPQHRRGDGDHVVALAPTATISSANTSVQVGAATLIGWPVAGSMTLTLWNWSASSSTAGG